MQSFEEGCRWEEEGSALCASSLVSLPSGQNGARVKCRPCASHLSGSTKGVSLLPFEACLQEQGVGLVGCTTFMRMHAALETQMFGWHGGAVESVVVGGHVCEAVVYGEAACLGENSHSLGLG